MAIKRYDSTRQWYAVHTYSGYEEKVADSVRQRINAVDMADKILELLDDPAQRARMGNYGRDRVESGLSWATQIEPLLGAYAQLLNRPAHG